MTAKLYVSAQGLLEDSFRLGAHVVKSGFRPNLIVAIWRGGTPVGIAVQELLAYAGIETDHIAIRTSSYDRGVDARRSGVRVHGMDYIVKRVNSEDRLLIVDDVFDTGHTIEAVVEHLRKNARRNTPREIRVAVPYFKPSRNQTGRVPEYYIHETDRWIKFPHSLEGLGTEEIEAHRPEIFAIVAPARSRREREG